MQQLKNASSNHGGNAEAVGSQMELESEKNQVDIYICETTEITNEGVEKMRKQTLILKWNGTKQWTHMQRKHESYCSLCSFTAARMHLQRIRYRLIVSCKIDSSGGGNTKTDAILKRSADCETQNRNKMRA